ncbi:MAG: YjgP/YjgQ family permease [Elusimicrobia bacterium]|nr:YjgP/YjgQ family permease [Elusimicrobiota bacterium]
MKVIRRYILNAYLSPFFKGLAALMLIMIVTHFFDFLHVFLSKKPPLSLVSVYFLNRLPEWFVLILPVATLLAILFSLGTLNRHHELTAIKSSGLRLQYVFIPIVLFSLGISVLSFFMQETLVPKGTAKAESLFLQIRDRKPKNINTERRNFKHMGEGRRLYSIEYFKDGKAEGFSLIEFFPNTFRERRHLYAKKANYTDDNEWTLSEGTIRVFDDKKELISFSEFHELVLFLKETPETFAKPEKNPEQMDFLSLLAYVGKL